MRIPILHSQGESRMTELPPGTNAIVDAALDDVAQTLFTAADVPLACSEELLAALQGPAMRSLMHMRIEQIVKHGHTAENDLMLPLMWLPKQAKDHAQIACDRVGVTGRIATSRRRSARSRGRRRCAWRRSTGSMPGFRTRSVRDGYEGADSAAAVLPRMRATARRRAGRSHGLGQPAA
jgi:hypothetical protein